MKSFAEFAEENLPGTATHIMNKDLRHPDHGIISSSTVLRHTGGNSYEVRAGRAKGKIISIPSEHVNKLNEGYEDHQLDELSTNTLRSYSQKAHTQVQDLKFGRGKDQPGSSSAIAKRETGMSAAGARTKKRDDQARASVKREREKIDPYKPLGGRDEKSGRSYSEEKESELGDLAHPQVTKHRFLVTYSDPNHTMVSKRKEKQQKHILFPGTDKKGSTIFKGDAEPLVKKYMNKQGYRVHEVEHVGMVTKRSGS